MIDRDRVREALTGPMTSISTPFNKDGTVDHDGLRRTLDFNIEAGSKTMLLTAGDSNFIAMSDAEIAEVSKTVVDHTAERAMVVTADRHFHTRQAVGFAKYAAEIGSDVHMVLPPDWASSCTLGDLARSLRGCRRTHSGDAGDGCLHSARGGIRAGNDSDGQETLSKTSWPSRMTCTVGSSGRWRSWYTTIGRCSRRGRNKIIFFSIPMDAMVTCPR